MLSCCLVAKLCPTLVTSWTGACQAPLSMAFPRQEYWNRLSFPPSGDLPDPRTEPLSLESPDLQADSLPTEPLGKPRLYLGRPNSQNTGTSQKPTN